MAIIGLKIAYQLSGVNFMTKERKSNREDKKKPAMTAKEKKAAKKSKKESRAFLGNDRNR
jgi:hypothetical protein